MIYFVNNNKISEIIIFCQSILPTFKIFFWNIYKKWAWNLFLKCLGFRKTTYEEANVLRFQNLVIKNMTFYRFLTTKSF